MRIYLILSIFILSIFNTFGQDNTTIHRLLDSMKRIPDKKLVYFMKPLNVIWKNQVNQKKT